VISAKQSAAHQEKEVGYILIHMPGEKRTQKVRGMPGKYTVRQAKLVKELVTSKTVTEAAVKAGFAPKHARQGAHQAMKAIRGRVPDMMDRLGLSEEKIIDKYLRRNLEKKKTVFVREEKVVSVGTGRAKREVVRHIVKKHVLDDNQIQLQAMDKAFLLHGSYAPRDPKEAAQFGVKVIVQNIRGVPRPPIDLKPGMEIPALEAEVISSNGHKKVAHKNGDK
jgi:hypothetical protein